MVAPNIVRLHSETEDEWKKRYASAYYQLNKSRWDTYKRDPEANRQNKKKYYEANKAKIKARTAEWRASNAELVQERQRRRYREKTHEYKQRNAAWYRANKEKSAQATKVWKEKNPESRKAIAKRWWSNNPDKTAGYWATRDARERQACPLWADISAIKAVYREARKITKETGVQHHVDHIVPLSGVFVSGLHVPCNLRIMLAVENMKKQNKLTEEALAICRSPLH